MSRAVPPGRAFEGAPADWDDALCAIGARSAEPWGHPHVLQSAAWGALKLRWGWRPERLAWGAPGAERAAAQILLRRAGGLTIGYAAKGPQVAGGPDAWRDVLSDLAVWARSRRLALLKIDADVPSAADEVAAVWRAAGFRPSAEPIQFPNTMESPLGDDAALDAAMSPKGRYNVRLAARRGVRVRRGGVGDLDAFADLYLATAARQGFAARSRAYYLDAWSAFLAGGQAAVLLAEREGALLAGALCVRFGPTAWYLYGASADVGREHMAPHAALAASLRWARDAGCARFDWWGGPTALRDDDPLWGVYRFKRQLGARWRPQLGAWDLAPDPVRHGAYRVLARARRWLLGLRRGRPDGGRGSLEGERDPLK